MCVFTTYRHFCPQISTNLECGGHATALGNENQSDGTAAALQAVYSAATSSKYLAKAAIPPLACCQS